MNNSRSQAILGRDMIDVTEEFSGNSDAFEYIDAFASQIAALVGSEAIID